jgi:hypothetical protein
MPFVSFARESDSIVVFEHNFRSESLTCHACLGVFHTCIQVSPRLSCRQLCAQAHRLITHLLVDLRRVGA